LLIKPQAREQARALVGAAALGSVVGLAIGGAYLAGGLARESAAHIRLERLAGAAANGFSEAALHKATGDDAVLALASTHDPFVLGTDAEKDRQAAALADRLQARRAVRERHAALRLASAAVASPAASPASAEKPILVSTAAIRAAEPFHMRGALDQTRDLECLTQAVYYESRGEPRSGQQAVAQVILNRVRHPGFPKSVCGVVFQGVKSGGCQFSFACDGQPHHPLENAAWLRSEAVASEALDGQVMSEVGDATHFHAAGRSTGWGAGLFKVAQIGAHVFYRLSGRADTPSRSAEPMGQRPVFASLSISGGPALASKASAELIASASHVVEEAASAVETVAKSAAAEVKGQGSAAKPALAERAAADKSAAEKPSEKAADRPVPDKSSSERPSEDIKTASLAVPG
jgi:spore germination cell wall hydrolase CwlJ-like protein